MLRTDNGLLQSSLRHQGRLGSRLLTAGLVLSGIAILGLSPNVARGSSPDGGILSGIAEWFTDDVIHGRGTSISSNGFGQTTASWSDGHNKLKVRIEGDVVFTDDDTAIRRIPRDGSIAIWEKKGSRSTEIKVTPTPGGEFVYDYRVAGKKTEYDAAGEAWLASVLVDIVRKTGIGGEARANRILDLEGVDGLLKEMQFIESDYVTRIFLGAALDRPDLTTSDCAAILAEATIAMESDYEMAELLLSVANHPNWNSSLAREYVNAVETMESDYEIRRCLSPLKLDESTDPRVLDGILRIADRMGSDYEIAELLVSLAPSCQSSEKLSEMYVHAASGIGSDYEARRALSALDWRKGMPASAVAGALGVAGRLESDYEAAEILVELAPHSSSDDRAVTAFMVAVGQINSDYEASRALSAFASADHLSESATLAALDAARKISSSYEQSGVLAKLVDHCRGSQTLEDAYLEAVDTVDGEYERDNLFSDFYRGDREARRARRGQ